MLRDSDLSIKTAADELACSTRTIWKIISQGDVQTYMVGRARRITRESMDAYKHAHMTSPCKPQAAA
ncbi:excisionase family DNA-binding protein [Rhodobacteraceae bacterium R_SAG10]|nr:excisionase family DNA-binding protein [Rhodobacteraceae bacterium R_SAG10]